MSYERLEATVLTIARRLRERGIVAGQLVALDAANEARHLCISLALELIGAAHFAAPADRISALEASLGVRFDALVLGRGNTLRVSVRPGANAGVDAVLMLASSGTTGRRKVSLLNHRQLLARFAGDLQVLPFEPTDVYRSLVRVGLTVAKQRALFALMRGATVCVDEPSSEPEARLAHLRRHRVTYLSGVPSHALGLALAAETAGGLPGLRVLRIGSSPVPQTTRALVRQRLTPHLHVNYGTNESGTVSVAGPDELLTVPGTVGRPSPSLIVEVVDASGAPMPCGQPGTVRMRGEPVIPGYLAPAEANEKSFRDGWFFPGDLASTMPDGQLVFHGRRDDTMIHDGVNIFPIEIEQALQTFDGVIETCAFPLHSDQYLHIPAAIVVAREDLDLARLHRHAERLLGFAHPRLIFAAESIPKNAMGKPDRQAIAQMLPGCRRYPSGDAVSD